MALMSLGSLNISLVRLRRVMSHGFPVCVCECQGCVFDLMQVLKVYLGNWAESKNDDGCASPLPSRQLYVEQRRHWFRSELWKHFLMSKM